MRHLPQVQRALLAWFASESRDLPWRRTRDPYAILVAETMLQQTQVDRVVPRYERFLARFPTVRALATTSRSGVIAEWSGLGYNNRAVRLHEAARAIVERHAGAVPASEGDLRALAGIGPYTAAAIRCFAFEQPVALVDTNHRRVLGRLFVGPIAPLRPMQADVFDGLAATALPQRDAWAWNQALMDLGATICTARAPRCEVCPVARWCPSFAPKDASPGTTLAVAEAPASYVAGRQTRFEGSRRWWRGRIMALLVSTGGGPHPADRVAAALGTTEETLRPILEALERDGLVRAVDGSLSLP